MLPTCERYGMGVIPWSPLAGGWLTGKYRKGDPQPTSGRAARVPARFDFSLPENKRKLDVVMAWSVDRLGRTHVTYRYYFDSSTVGTFRT